jgi:hypothetical protein
MVERLACVGNWFVVSAKLAVVVVAILNNNRLDKINNNTNILKKFNLYNQLIYSLLIQAF